LRKLKMLPTLQKLRMLSRLLVLNVPTGPFATTPDGVRLRLERASLRTVASFFRLPSRPVGAAEQYAGRRLPDRGAAHVVDLGAGGTRTEGGSEMADRNTRERKLIALMINDLGASSEPDASRIEEEVGALSDEELDRMLTGRLDLPHPVDEAVMDRALARVEEPEELSDRGGFTGAPDMSHDPRPEEREG